VRTIYWFEGKKFLDSSAPGHPLAWQASPGDWRLVAMDDQGRQATRNVRIVADAR
jgi:membrane carboxypeptidase/penicillin-binding protein PbpC